MAMPEVALMLATAALLLLHMPPVVALVRLVVAPEQMFIAPVRAAGTGSASNSALRTQPVPDAV